MILQDYSLINLSVKTLDERIEKLNNEIAIIETRGDENEDWDRAHNYGRISMLEELREKLIPAKKLASAAYMQGAMDYCKSPETINNFKISETFLQSDIKL